MKKFVAIVLVLVYCLTSGISTAFSQSASTEKYALLKIYLQPGVKEKLQAKGVYFDEGAMVPGKYFISVFSEWAVSYTHLTLPTKRIV